MNVNRVLDEIREQVSTENLIDSCSGEGCRVDMTDISSHRVVIDVEHEFDLRKTDNKRGDRLLFYINTAENNLVAAPIELKSGKAYESDVVEKLENTLDFAASIAPEPKIVKTDYVPILFHNREIQWATPKGSKRKKQLTANFRGRPVQILTGRCSNPNNRKNLARVLSDAGYL